MLITDEQIAALRTEAMLAGDDTQTELCERAWRGDTDACEACAKVIADTQVQR